MLDRIALPVIKGSMMVLNQLSNLETTVGMGEMTKPFPLHLPGLLALEDGGSLRSLLRLVKRLLLSS